MSTFLAGKGIEISRGYSPENIPSEVDLVVVGNAVCRGNPELEAVLNRRLLYRSLPETLRDFFLQGKTNIVVSGTHGKTTTTSLVTWLFREAGCDAVQEVAFTLADGIAYTKAAIEAGLDVDTFGAQLSFFFNVHNNLLEEVAKFRAARRMWSSKIGRAHV